METDEQWVRRQKQDEELTCSCFTGDGYAWWEIRPRFMSHIYGSSTVSKEEAWKEAADRLGRPHSLEAACTE